MPPGEALADRVAVIGDVHAEDSLLKLALERFAELEIRAVLCTGDVVDGLGSAQRCCDLLAGHAVATVRGNHDRWIVEGTMRSLPGATAIEQLTFFDFVNGDLCRSPAQIFTL